MRTRFHEDLERLTSHSARMCRRDRAVLAAATTAVLRRDVEQAEYAITLAGEVAGMGRTCERRAVRLLALQAPVASELRRVVVALQLADDLTRMAVLAGHIAEIARRRHPDDVAPGPAHELVERMGAVGLSMVTGAVEILESRDPALAAGLAEQDGHMNALHESLLGAVLTDDWSDGACAAADLALIGRFYERFADHVVRIGSRVATTSEIAGRYVGAEPVR